MFSGMLIDLQNGKKIDFDLLQRRFDLAITKKLGTIKLPSAFWSGDPKINPPADQLFLASLVLGDAERAALAVTTLAAERERDVSEIGMEKLVQVSLDRILQSLPENIRTSLAARAYKILPDYFTVNG